VPKEKWGYPEKPDALWHLWEAFIDLNNARQSGLSMQPISYQEIQAYCNLMNVKFSSFEISAIKQLDMAAITATNKKD
jgi:hypothetical protein